MVQMYAYLDPLVCQFLEKVKNQVEYPWVASFLEHFRVCHEKSFKVEAEEVVQGL